MDTLISLIIDALCTSRFFFLGRGEGLSFVFLALFLADSSYCFLKVSLCSPMKEILWKIKWKKKLADFRF